MNINVNSINVITVIIIMPGWGQPCLAVEAELPFSGCEYRIGNRTTWRHLSIKTQFNQEKIGNGQLRLQQVCLTQHHLFEFIRVLSQWYSQWFIMIQNDSQWLTMIICVLSQWLFKMIHNDYLWAIPMIITIIHNDSSCAITMIIHNDS